MLPVKQLLLLSTSLLTSVQAQRQIAIAGYSFDTTSCVDTSGINSCSAQALSDYNHATSTCGSTQSCLTVAEIDYDTEKLYCLIQSCWNLAPGCDFQLAIAAYLKFTVVLESLPQQKIPFYYTGDIRDEVPGACACNIARLSHLSYGASNSTGCIASDLLDTDFLDTCLCCAYSQVVSAYYDLCPSNDLTPVDALAQRINGAIQYVAGLSDNQCAFLNNQASASATCAVQEVTVSGSAGYLNPATLPAGFPGTAPLSDLPGTVTALSQLGVTATTTVVVDAFGVATNTLTFAKATGAAGAASTAKSAVVSTAAPATATVVPATSPQTVTLSGTGTNSAIIVTTASSAAALSSAALSQASHASSSAAIPSAGGAATSASAVTTSTKSASPALEISHRWTGCIGLCIAILISM